jgi:hypothetical protein
LRSPSLPNASMTRVWAEMPRETRLGGKTRQDEEAK